MQYIRTVRPSPIGLAALVPALALTLAACDDVVEPPGGPTVVTINQVVTGTLEPGAVHLFLVRGREGDALRARLRFVPAGDEDVIALQVRDVLNNATLARVILRAGVDPPDGDSGWFGFPRDEPYLIRVAPMWPGHAGSYEFELEALQYGIAYGDTVAGGVFGREQVFRFDAGADDEFVVYLQRVPTRLVSAPPGVGYPVRLRVSGTAAETQAAASYAQLERISTGVAQIVSPGEQEVLISGWGDYRFMVRPVDRRPSAHDPQIAPGDRVVEAIDHVADIDEFTFQGQAGQEFVATAYRIAGLDDGFSLVVEGSDGQVLGDLPHDFQPHADTMFSRRFALPATGDYTVRVRGHAAGAPEQATGIYGFEILPVTRVPAVNPVQIPMGEWVAGDALRFVGDLHEYRLTVDEDGPVVVGFGQDDPAAGARMTLWVLTGTGGALVQRLSQGGGVQYHQFTPPPGEYRVLVEAVWQDLGLPTPPPRPGAYRFRFSRPEPAPERLSSTIVHHERDAMP